MPDVSHASLTGATLHEPLGVDSAALNTVYLADNLGSGAWTVPAAAITTIADAASVLVATNVEDALQELADVPVGELYITNNSANEVPTGAGTYDVWTTAWVQGTVKDVTTTAGSGFMTCNTTGLYRATCTLSLEQSAATATTWLLAVAVNPLGAGSFTADTSSIQKMTTALVDAKNVTLTAIVSLTATDEIAIVYQQASGTANEIFAYANFNLTYLRTA